MMVVVVAAAVVVENLFTVDRLQGRDYVGAPRRRLRCQGTAHSIPYLAAALPVLPPTRQADPFLCATGQQQ